MAENQRNVLVGGVGGAALGALAGAGGDVAEATGVGLLAGALIGALIPVDGGDLEALQADRDRLAAELAQLQTENQKLKDRIKELGERIASLKGVEYTMLNDVLFSPGKAKLTDEGKAALDKVAADIKKNYPNQSIRFEGHTDSQPIVYSGFKSNWELGSARALAVLHYLIDSHGIDPARCSASTYSMYKPRASNDTAEGRAKNRRSVIVVWEDPRSEY